MTRLQERDLASAAKRGVSDCAAVITETGANSHDIGRCLMYEGFPAPSKAGFLGQLLNTFGAFGTLQAIIKEKALRHPTNLFFSQLQA
mmetsp:Transcript_56187/g.100090  ORF Transcript_56187/g.100090 Transcript_56187/m.100090 type:complete len:88 (+) Transcript_56187:118-381(+)